MALPQLLSPFLLLLLTHLGSAMHPSRVTVHIPADLHKPQGEEHAHAHFGFGYDNYKGSISAYVYYVESPNQFCTSVDFLNNETMGYPTTDGPDASVPFIIVTNASEWCSPVTQTRHAQSLGAAAVLLAYDGCPCEKSNCTPEHDSKHCVGEEYLVNDGSGGDVTIPTFLLYKHTSDQLYHRTKYLNSTILMELTWGLPMTEEKEKEEGPYKLHLWSSARDPLLSLENYQNLYEIANAFRSAAPFEPRPTLLNGTLFGCTYKADANVTHGPCKDMCTNSGRYCALVSADGVTGRSIIRETVRRLCIWKHFGQADASQYWKYLLHHTEVCHEPHLFDEEECIVKSYKAAKIHDTHEKILDCMLDSGELDKDMENTLLEDALVQQKHSGVVQLPAVTIGNYHQYHDLTTGFFIFEGLCRHFWSRSNVMDVPKICYKCATCPNVVGCIKEGHCVALKPDKHHHHDSTDGGKPKKKRKRRRRGWLIFFSLVAIVGVGAFLYKKRQEQMDGMGGGVGMLNGYFRVDGGSGAS